MGTYFINDFNRRDIVRMSAALTCATILSSSKLAVAETLRRTPEQILGPFYPLKELPQTSDLTRLPGRAGRANGQVLNVMGRALNLAGEPVRNAKVEIWQANASGRYTHPSDTNPAPLDPNFEGSAVLTTDSEGRYRFKTIKPAAYPAGPNFMRPAHIHFQVSGRQDRLVTQMYFENDPYNDSDPFLNSAGRKELLIKSCWIQLRNLKPTQRSQSSISCFTTDRSRYRLRCVSSSKARRASTCRRNDVGLWHKCEVPTASGNVRCSG